ncbi:MAG: hypothetical protein MJZ92_03160 [Paludibacteraceae bacterium]|nr:hypothetical protein [Paludibacteraceae bacterium]
MKLKNLISTPCGLRYMVERLDIQSGVARRMLLEREMMTSALVIESYYEELNTYIQAAQIPQNALAIRNIQFRLQNLKDIRTTLQNLADGKTLDEIELFEIKHLAILTNETGQQMDIVGIGLIDFGMNEVIAILDPEKQCISSFYLYDAYSETLCHLRKELEKNPTNEEIYCQLQEEELRVRQQLTSQLREYKSNLSLALQQLAEIDIYLSQAKQYIDMSLCLPTLSRETRLTEMWNPEVAESVSHRGITYQANSISLSDCPTVLTGSNMGGKTVVLKTVALCQLLMQFGCGVPAKHATMRPFDAIYCQMADGQSTEAGLSSFGAEMKSLNEIIAAARSNKNILALIDEPARTTNPVEGTALVSALLDTLQPTGITLLLVTHYIIMGAHACAYLRVKGLEEGKMNYALVPTRKGDVPHEALRIAEQLGTDDEWLQKAKTYLTT